MLTISTTGIKETIRDLERMAKQVRYATAVALTRTAQAIAKKEEQEVAKVFDKPVAFTRRAFAVRGAKSGSLVAEVFIKDRQARYLAPSIRGGGRLAKQSEVSFTADTKAPGVFWVPGPGIKLNAAGNISKQQVIRIAAALKQSGRHGDVFAGIPRQGMAFGIYRRKSGKGKSGIEALLIQVKRAPTYRKLFDFYGVGQRVAAKEFERQFAQAFDQAMRTAR